MENYFHPRMTEAQVKAISNVGLAHIGDGVYELLCRTYLCTRGDTTLKNLHKHSVELVKAPTQARFAGKLRPLLTEEEDDFFRRGKNAHTHAAPKSASKAEYTLATGLEALFGALYLLGRQDRLNELFQICVEGND